MAIRQDGRTENVIAGLNSMIKNRFYQFLTYSLNQYVNLDPEFKATLSQVTGKIVSIKLLPFMLSFQCEFTDGGIVVHADEHLLAQAKISGTPLQLLNALFFKTARRQFFAADVIIEGDVELAKTIVDIFDRLEVDWEEQLSKLFGDVSAHYLSRSVHYAKGQMNQSCDNFVQNIKEYLHEEIAILPAREDMSMLFNDIDDLRMDVDRLAARILNLQQTMHSMYTMRSTIKPIDEGNQ